MKSKEEDIYLIYICVCVCRAKDNIGSTVTEEMRRNSKSEEKKHTRNLEKRPGTEEEEERERNESVGHHLPGPASRRTCILEGRAN